jgi:hypothetical protein
MKTMPVSLVVEGPLDEQVLRQLITQTAQYLDPIVCYGKSGRDDVRRNVLRFNQAARHQPFIVLADLEQDECPPALIRQWLPDGAHPNLVLRIAVRMVESWLLADQQALARFLGVSPTLAAWPRLPDQETDSKLALINVARRSRYRYILQDIVPAPGGTSRVGKNYAGRLTQFVLAEWKVERACQASPSLDRAVRALQRYSPRATWGSD